MLSFGGLVRSIRERYGYRQTDFAEMIGTAVSVVSSWETSVRRPSRSRIDDLARRFPSYRSRFYVSARLLPDELESETESELCIALDRDSRAWMK